MSDLGTLMWVRAAAADGQARKIRSAARISIPELAEHLGVTPATVSRWETGERMPRGKHAMKYADALRTLKEGAVT